MKSNPRIYIERINKTINFTTLKYLLDLFNKIWEEGIVPEGYKFATITPLLKEGKGPRDVRSYLPVSLTNILCQIFKRMTNKRLIWYLQKKKKR